MSIVDIVVKAINEKKALSFSYHGFERVVSPFAVGVNPVNEIKMIGYQTEGGSNSGVTKKLRFFAVEDMMGPELSDAPIVAPCDACKATYKELATVYAQVE